MRHTIILMFLPLIRLGHCDDIDEAAKLYDECVGDIVATMSRTVEAYRYLPDLPAGPWAILDKFEDMVSQCSDDEAHARRIYMAIYLSA